MSNELGVESFIDEEESDLINSLFLDGVDSSDSILNSQKREGGEECVLGSEKELSGVCEKELSGVCEKELSGVCEEELSGVCEKEAGQSQDVKDAFVDMDDKEDAFEGVSDVGATEEKTVANEKETSVNEEEVVRVAEENGERKSEEVVIEEEKEKEEKNEEKEEKKDEQSAITTNEKEENTAIDKENDEKQEQNNTKTTKPTHKSTRKQNRKPSPREEITEDAQPENSSAPIDIVEDSVVVNPPSALRAQQNIRISEPRKMTLRPRTKKSPTVRRTKRANTEMLSQPPAVEEAVRKRRRRDTDCETQRSEVGLEERVRDSQNERRSEANAHLIELGILRTTTSSDVWRARWQ